MAEIKACIFDLDGVIVDTAHFHFLAWRRLCLELGFDLSEEENEGLKGVSRAESLDILLAKGEVEASAAEKDEMMNRKNAWYLEYVDSMGADEILPGVLHFLKTLKDHNYLIALGSSSKNAMRILQKINVLPYFDEVIDGTKVSRGKPDPQTFQLGAEALKVNPEFCVVFEDAVAGIDAARAAGMYAIGIGQADVLSHAHVVLPGFEGLDTAIFNKL
jgi:beta-phosphoglucomutase